MESVGQAIKMVRELIKRGNSAGDAAKKAASRYQVPMDQVSKAVSEPGTGGDPRLLARGGAVANTPATARRASFVPGKGFRRGPLVG